MGLLYLMGESAFNPRTLFANGEQGLWLDPSDMNATKAGWRRNLLTYSEQFDNSAWSKNNGTITANSTASPFGETTADTITQSGGTVLAFVERSITLINPINQTYTLSVYAKKNTLRDYLLIEERWSGASQRAYFDIASGTVLGAAGTHTAQIQNIGSGWYRCSVTFTVTTVATTSIFIGPSGAGTIIVPADGGSMFLFGAQLELGSTPTEYQRITDFSTEFKAAFPTHTLYQDSNGITPCTAAGDPVGLILDQSRGGLSQIGADLVTNGGFAADTDWTKGANWTIGSGVATKTGGAANNLTQTIGSTAAAWYRISLDVTRSAGTLTVSLGTSGTTYAITATGSYTFFILAGSGTQTLTLAGDSSFAGTVDNVAVRNVPGNHAYQTTSASRPTLARIPSSGRRNLLTRTEELSNAAWSTGASNLGTRTNGSVSVSNAEGYVYIKQFGSFSDSVDHVLSFDVTCDQSITDVPIRAAGTVSVSQLVTLSAGVATRVTLTGYRPTGGASPNIEVGIDARNAIVPGGSNSTGYTVTFNRVQLETGSTATNYQKVVATTDVTESGFADLWHLVFDGSDDSLVTNSVDFSGTDEMTVIAGLRKLSDAASATFVEASSDAGSNSGAFAVYAPRVANAAVEYRSRGTLTVTSNEGIASAAPTTLVFTGQSDISDDSLTVRKNGVQANTSAADQGTGNYGNHILYIGRRGGTTLPYNGHLYQLIVRGKTTPTGKLLEAERFTAKKTGLSI